jgi:hypothetical protein
MADYKLNPPAKENVPTKSPDGSQQGGARIWNVFKSTIVLDELSVPEAPQGERKTQRIEDLVSMEFPLIKINDYYFSQGEIDSFSIDSTGKVPKITLSVSFPNELFLSKNMPKDGDIISVAIRSKAEVLKPIRNDYVITGVIAGKRNTNLGGLISMTFFGELFIPGWNSFLGVNSYKGTSMEVLKKGIQSIGLGFNTNEENTEDKQIWLVYNSPADFIAEVCERSWKEENAFFDWWIDVYYNLNFVNVQKQLLASESAIDEAALIGNIPQEYYWGSDEDKVVGTAKVFSNYIGFRTSSFYIRNWRPINRSSAITFEYGTSINCTFFEHNNILYEDPGSQKYWELDISPNYDPDKVNSHILLRGRATWDPSINNDEPARANYNYRELYQSAPWLGIQYTISNPEDDNTKWTGNQHRNYMRAKAHNIINKVELEKLIIEIEVQGTNLNIIKGDKVPIVLLKKDRVEALLVDEDFDSGEVIEFFYTGWYYVKGFTLDWTGGDYGNLMNNFSQTFILTRREWPAPVPTAARKKADPTIVVKEN